MKKVLVLADKVKYFFIFFFIFLIPRVIGLGKSVYAVDAYRWDLRSDRFVEAVLTGNFIETYQKYHPGVTLMWLSGFSKKLYRILFEMKRGYSPMIDKGIVYPEQFYQNLFVAKLPLVLVISFLLALSLFFLYKLKFNIKFLILFSIFLSLEPFFLGVTRFLHLTGLEAACGLASIVIVYYYSQTKSYYLVPLAGFIIALGVLTKISFLVFLPYMGVTLFLGLVVENKKGLSFPILFRSLLFFLQMLLYSVVFIFFIWPALWVAPLGILERVWNEGVKSTGMEGNPGFSLSENRYLYYYEISFFRISGLLLISWFGSIFYFIKDRKKKFSSEKLFMLLMLFFLPYYAFIMALPGKQVDRYAVVLFPFFIFCATYFLYRVYLSINPKLKILLLFFIFTYLGVMQWVYFPVYSSPMTELVGGPRGYSNLAKMRNRGEFYLQATQYLNEKDGQSSYEKNLVIPQGEKDLSAKGYLGKVYSNKSMIPAGKDAANYYAVDYLDLEDVPKNRDCGLIKEFGYRWPLKFTYLYLFECE